MNGHEIDKNNQLICTVQMITNIIINGLALMRVFDESAGILPILSVYRLDFANSRSNPEHHFWYLSQSIISGVYPRALILGSIPEKQLWDLSQNNSSRIYPRALVSGSIPEH